MTLLARLAKNTTYQLIARTLTTLANFVIILLVAKSLGSFGLGQYNKVFAFVGIFSLLVDFGLSATFLKVGKTRRHLFLLIFLRLVIAASIFLLIQPILYLLPYNEATQSGFSRPEKLYIQVVAVVLFLYAVIHSLYSIFQKKERFDLTIWPSFLYGVVALTIAFYSFLNKNLLFFFLATLVALLTQAGLAYYLIVHFLNLKKGKKRSGQREVQFIKKLFIKSLPLGTTLFLNVLYVRVDVLILSLLRSTSEVGIYSLAYKFFEFPLNLSHFMMTALYPVFLKLRKKGADEFYPQIKKSTLVIFIFALLATFFAFVLAPLISLIKQEFVLSVLPFRILVFSYPVFFLSNLFLWVTIAENREKILPFVYSLSLTLNLVLNLVFIPQFGYNAAAVVTVVSEFFVLLLFVFNLKKMIISWIRD